MVALRQHGMQAVGAGHGADDPVAGIDVISNSTAAGAIIGERPENLAAGPVLLRAGRWRWPARPGRRRALVVGPRSAAARLIERIRADRGSPLRVAGTCAPIGASVLDAVRALRVDLVLLAGSATPRTTLVATLAAAPAEVVACGPVDAPVQDAEPVRLGDLTGVRLLRRPLRPAQRLAKAVFDRGVAAALLLLLSPLLLLIALAIVADSRGPVFYRHRRHGLGLQEFRILKFRTMRTEPGAGRSRFTIQARPNDPRVTRVGRILRRTSLDELPQLFNVLGGSMSLVGPRPHPVDFVERYGELVPRYLERHRVIPGMTGRAQVLGLRGPVRTIEDLRRRTREDLAYAASWSFGGDLAILLRSAPLLVGDESAL